MTFVRWPRRVEVPFMPVSPDDLLTGWTAQPGHGGDTIVEVVGPGPSVEAVPVAALDRIAQPARAPSNEKPLPGASLMTGKYAFQEECVQAVQDTWRRKKKGIVCLPTGVGKTIVSAALMCRADGRSLFLAPRTVLLDQTAEKIRMVRSDVRVGIVQAARNDMRRDITVASIDTLASQKRLAQFLAEGGAYENIVIDEAHHCVSPKWMRVISALIAAWPGVNVVGLTATPGREDGLALDRVFDEVCYSKTIFEMIDIGVLVPPRYFPVPINVDLDRAEAGVEYDRKALGSMMNTPPVNRAVVEAWQRYGHDRKTGVFSVDIDHSEALAQTFIEAGYTATAVHTRMKKAEIRQRLLDFRNGVFKLLCSCDMITEGYDDPSMEAVLFARPTQSQTIYIQSVGRALRLYPSKTEALVIDCVGNSTKHKPVQLASIAGFDPLRKGGTLERAEPEVSDPTVIAARLGESEELPVVRIEKTKYQWHKTSLGWALRVPRVGYYMLAWDDAKHVHVSVRFYDQRKGRKHDEPKQILSRIEFQMAYGMVEAEMDRFFRAGSREDDNDTDLVSFVDLDEGLDEEVHVDEEEMLSDAKWREHPTSSAQWNALLKLGLKEENIPETKGEATDLITVMRIERDSKMRLPATEKQTDYLRRTGLLRKGGEVLAKRLTKGRAAALIWRHRKIMQEIPRLQWDREIARLLADHGVRT